MWRRLQNLFAYRTDSVIGVDISGGAVKVAELGWDKGRPVLTGAGIVELPPDTMTNGYFRDKAALTETLRRAVNVSSVKQREAVFAIGSPVLFIREVTYPAMRPEELAEAIRWDSEKHVILAPDTYYLDHAVISQQDNELKVLLAAAPREIIDDLVGAAKDAGLRPVAIDAEPLALYRTMNGADNSVIVDIGTDVSKVTMFQNGSPVVARSIPIGGRRVTEVIMDVFQLDFVEAERIKQRQKGLLKQSGQTEEPTIIQQQLEYVVAELARETARTVEYYGMQHANVLIDKVVLAGGGARLDNLADYFAAHFEAPVVLHNLLDNIGISRLMDQQHVHKLSLQIAVAVGLALGGGGL